MNKKKILKSPSSFKPVSQQTITCCLISLALQIRPKAGAVVAAAEEIGQNDHIM